jgi:hypothetical protein
MISKTGEYIKELKPVFDQINILGSNQGNTRLGVIYKNESFNLNVDDINIFNSNGVKCDMYGISCGNPQCKNGIIGFSYEVEKGRTTSSTTYNTAIWEKGKMIPANVTTTTTYPDKTIKTAQYCTNKIHSVKSVLLFWNQYSKEYEIHK